MRVRGLLMADTDLSMYLWANHGIESQESVAKIRRPRTRPWCSVRRRVIVSGPEVGRGAPTVIRASTSRPRIALTTEGWTQGDEP
jgi:hypothetical protein